MADYFDEMGWNPLGENESPNTYLHLARLFRDFNMFDELDMLNGQQLAPPASKSVVENLPNHEIIQEGIQCPVCLKKYDIGEKTKKLPCDHSFHSECIMPWLNKTNSCPLCRFELPTDDEIYEARRQEKIRAKERERDIELLHNSMFS